MNLGLQEVLALERCLGSSHPTDLKFKPSNLFNHTWNGVRGASWTSWTRPGASLQATAEPG